MLDDLNAHYSCETLSNFKYMLPKLYCVYCIPFLYSSKASTTMQFVFKRISSSLLDAALSSYMPR